MKKVLLTGESGVGKSTLLSSVIAEFTKKQGFITTENRTDGVRTSFEMTASNGESFVLCSVDSPSEMRVSRYGVNLQDLDTFVGKLPDIEDNKLIYVDEIGQMQLYSEPYKKLINEYLTLPNPFIGTLSKIYHDEFTDGLRARDDIEIIEVTVKNRNKLKDELVSRVAEYIH